MPTLVCRRGNRGNRPCERAPLRPSSGGVGREALDSGVGHVLDSGVGHVLDSGVGHVLDSGVPLHVLDSGVPLLHVLNSGVP